MRTLPSRPLPFWAAPIVAALGGAVLAGAFPSLGWWPLAVPGVALILFALKGRSLLASFAVGLTGGFAFYGIHIVWLTTYLGAVPWVALAGLQSVFFALGGLLITLAWRFGPRVWPGAWGRLLGVATLLAGQWVVSESVTSVWPYGSFS